VQRPGPPIIVGGRGPKRTPELAARFADEFNMPFKTVAETATAFQRVRAAAEAYARPAGRALTLSAGVVAAIGRTDAEAQRRAAPLHVPSALPPEDPVIGSPDQLVQRLGELAEVGATRVHLRVLDMTDLDHVELIASSVLPQVAS
jgi:alkanesulfonate monooxygenase SsuD/methylene tetrahydromethanopterin reductase-like flavin-dependent oxidoreductase (luciferase family)